MGPVRFSLGMLSSEGQARPYSARKTLTGSNRKPREALAIVGECLGERLHRDIANQLRIARAVDLAHAARTERPDDFVVAQARPARQRHAPAILLRHLARGRRHERVRASLFGAFRVHLVARGQRRLDAVGASRVPLAEAFRHAA
jgi:hypothetical protein